MLKLVLGIMNKDVVNIPSGTNGTFLHAVIYGGKDVKNKVNVLLKHGADPSIIGGDRTTLNVATYFYFKSVVQFFFDKLPETTSRRRFMNVAGVQGTSIQIVITGLRNANSEEIAVELVELLRSENAPFTHSRIFGENLLHAAVRVYFSEYSENVVK